MSVCLSVCMRILKRMLLGKNSPQLSLSIPASPSPCPRRRRSQTYIQVPTSTYPSTCPKSLPPPPPICLLSSPQIRDAADAIPISTSSRYYKTWMPEVD